MPDDAHILRHRGTRAIQRMVEFAPSTGGLALWVQHHDLPDDVDAPPIATDGNSVFYGIAFEALSLTQQVGLLAHEVLHIALRHTQRFIDLRRVRGDVDLELFNICADAIVNSTLGHLTWMQLPVRCVTLDQLLKRTLNTEQNVEAALLEWDVERLYLAIDDRRTPQQGGRQQNRRRQAGSAQPDDAGAQGGPAQRRNESRQGSGHEPHAKSEATLEDAGREDAGREDGPRASRARELFSAKQADLQPGPETLGLPESEAEQAREWSERVLRAHAGDGVHSMLRALIADLPRTRTPWEQVLRTQLARNLAARPALSWSRPSRSYLANQGRCGPNRRMPWEPGFSPTKSVPRLVVIVDVSGSIENELMERFAREIEAITRRQEAGMVLIIGDNRVRNVARFEPGRSNLRDIDFHGGGGTDFTPMLEEADRHRPDIAVVLTDLEGPANFRPAWPVIWAVPDANRHAIEPFGRKLVLN